MKTRVLVQSVEIGKWGGRPFLEKYSELVFSYFEVLVEHLGGNVQQAVENVGLGKVTWVRAKDNRCESHSL